MGDLFGGSQPSPPKPPKDVAATKAQADLLRKRQGGGLFTQTNTSGMRNMIDSYQTGLKSTLGA